MIENQTSPRKWASLLRISKSQIQTYLICPRKFYFQYVMGAMPEFLPAALPFGSALHGAVAAFYRAIKETGSKPELGFVMREFELEWGRATVGHRMSFKGKTSVVTGASTALQHMTGLCEIDESLPLPEGLYVSYPSFQDCRPKH